MSDTPSYDAWLKHRNECRRCWEWFCAKPGAALCNAGEKVHAVYLKMGGR